MIAFDGNLEGGLSTVCDTILKLHVLLKEVSVSTSTRTRDRVLIYIVMLSLLGNQNSTHFNHLIHSHQGRFLSYLNSQIVKIGGGGGGRKIFFGGGGGGGGHFRGGG